MCRPEREDLLRGWALAAGRCRRRGAYIEVTAGRRFWRAASANRSVRWGRGSDGVPTEVHHVQLLRDPDRLRHGRRGEPANAGADLMVWQPQGALVDRAAADRSRGALQARAASSPRRRPAAIDVGRAAGAELLRQQLPRPRRPPGARRRRPRRRSTAMASAWPRCASSAAPRTCTSSSRRGIAALPRHGGRHPLLVLLRRQRRPLRDAARRGGRGHLRRAQPRLDHRRRPALQGEALPLRQQRHGRPRGAA